MSPTPSPGTADESGGDRPAQDDDVARICLALPDVELGTTWGDRPTYVVRAGSRQRGFCLYRAPHPTATDPDTGEEYDDLLVITTADAEAKAELVQAEGPFFTVPHLDRSSAVLVQRSRLGEITLGELTEVLTDAWAARAPKTLVRAHLAGRHG